MADSLWAALALVLVIEGALPFVAPRLWRESFLRIMELTDGQLRFIGLGAILTGIAAYLLLRHA